MFDGGCLLFGCACVCVGESRRQQRQHTKQPQQATGINDPQKTEQTHRARLGALHGAVLGGVAAARLFAIVRKHALLPVVRLRVGARHDLVLQFCLVCLFFVGEGEEEVLE